VQYFYARFNHKGHKGALNYNPSTTEPFSGFTTTGATACTTVAMMFFQSRV